MPGRNVLGRRITQEGEQSACSLANFSIKMRFLIIRAFCRRFAAPQQALVEFVRRNNYVSEN
jgi:hypothetical protein